MVSFCSCAAWRVATVSVGWRRCRVWFGLTRQSVLQPDCCTAQTASLSFKTDAMALDRLFNGGEKRMIGAGECIDKVFDELQVGTSMEGTAGQFLEVADLFCPVPEPPDMKTFLISEDFAVCHSDMGSTTILLCENIH